MKLQYSSPSLHLSSGWAELVTSHALPGPGVIEGLKSVATPGSGCVLVAEMTTQDCLTSTEYIKGQYTLSGYITIQDCLLGCPNWRYLSSYG